MSKSPDHTVNIHNRWWRMNTWRNETSVLIREMQIQTTVRYHYTPARTAEMESAGKEMEDLELSYASGGSTVVRLLWETPPLFLINSCPSYVPAILLPVIYPREMKPYMHTKACMQMFTETFFIIAKKLEVA